MLTAKESFLDRISTFEKIVSPVNPIDSVLMSRELTQVEHNAKVNFLRNGMAIIGYTILEDFLKKKVGEMLKDIGRTSVSFSTLPKSIQEACTITALKGIQVRADNLKRASENYLQFIQNETRYISSTKDAVFELSEFSLGWDKSNISNTDVGEFMRIFNINKGWDCIQLISSVININLTNPSEIYRNAAQRRHRAAHNSETQSLLTDLQSFVTHAKVIALGFDTLLSKSLQHIRDNNSDFLAERLKTDFDQLSFRFLINYGGMWKESKQLNGRAYRTNSSYDDLFPDTYQRARANTEILIIKDDGNRLVNWYAP